MSADTMIASPLDARLLLLDPHDNVVVARQRLAEGERVTLDTGQVTLRAALPIGHKLARRSIAEGQRVLKYGAPIGRATCAIAAGEHVHTHNLRSDYTPSYTLDAARATHEGEAHAGEALGGEA